MSTDMALSDRRILSNKRKFEVMGCRTVFVYKTRKPAVAKFLALCEKQEQVNAEMRAEAQGLHRKAQQGDLGAALTLGMDY